MESTLAKYLSHLNSEVAGKKELLKLIYNDGPIFPSANRLMLLTSIHQLEYLGAIEAKTFQLVKLHANYVCYLRSLYCSLCSEKRSTVSEDAYFFFLLSDNPAAIELLFKQFQFDKIHLQSGSGMMERLLIIENLLLDDYEATIHYSKLHLGANSYRHRLGKGSLMAYDLFVEGIMAITENNAIKAEHKVNTLITFLAKKPNLHGIYSYPGHPTQAFLLAKLAWLKGLEVEVKHDFFMQELLPIKPLIEYPMYDFVTDPSIMGSKGLIDRLKGFFKK
jgi:hypothetical protein